MSGQGQGEGLRPSVPSDINTSNIAGDLANQLAPGPGVNGQRPASNDVAGDLANQIAEGGASAGQGQPQGQEAAGQQRGSAGAAIIEIRSTIIQEANGQQLATAVVEPGQEQQAAAPAAPTEAPAMTPPQPPAPPAPPAEARPTEAPAAMPAPVEPQSQSTAAEAASKPEAQPTQPPAEGMSAMVSVQLSLYMLYLAEKEHRLPLPRPLGQLLKSPKEPSLLQPWERRLIQQQRHQSQQERYQCQQQRHRSLRKSQ